MLKSAHLCHALLQDMSICVDALSEVSTSTITASPIWSEPSSQRHSPSLRKARASRGTFRYALSADAAAGCRPPLRSRCVSSSRRVMACVLSPAAYRCFRKVRSTDGWCSPDIGRAWSIGTQRGSYPSSSMSVERPCFGLPSLRQRFANFSQGSGSSCIGSTSCLTDSSCRQTETDRCAPRSRSRHIARIIARLLEPTSLTSEYSITSSSSASCCTRIISGYARS